MNAAVLTCAALLSSAVASPAWAFPAPQANKKPTPPPGMVLIEGGPTKIGSTVDYVMELGKQNEQVFGNVVCETPQHEVRVDDFFLMVNELTNEQYAAFVRATGRRAPEHWAEAVINEAQREFLLAEAELKRKAKEEGKNYESRKFDRGEWWKRNGLGKPWEIPAGKATHPVVFVDYEDAKEYARWAGVRLPTEFEFQRAGRGKSDALYPWGSDADPKHCANLALQLTDIQAVGSYPSGATAVGVHDLSGNVFEWTSSPFSPYPRFKMLTLEVGAGKQARKIDGLVAWDANKRVLVSGSFQNSLIVNRLSMRRPTDRDQATDSTGFRCAASIAPGADMANAVMNDDFPAEQRPKDSQFDVGRVLAADRWRTEAGTSKLENYAIITGYDYLMFVPAVEIDAVTLSGLLDRATANGYQPLGVLSTTVPVIEPALPPGSYMVALRAASKGPVEAGAPAEEKKSGAASQAPQDPKAEEAAPTVLVKLPPDMPTKEDTVIFYSRDGEPVAWIPAPSMEFGRPLPASMTIAASKRRVMRTGDDGKEKPFDEDVTAVTMKLYSLARISNKAFSFSLKLSFAPGAITTDWRQ